MSESHRQQSTDYGDPEHYGEKDVLPTINARQGVTGHNVRRVLVFSTGVVIAILAVIYLFVVGI